MLKGLYLQQQRNGFSLFKTHISHLGTESYEHLRTYPQEGGGTTGKPKGKTNKKLTLNEDLAPLWTILF